MRPIGYKRSTLLVCALTATLLLYGCSTHPVQNKPTNFVPTVQNPPYDYNPIMGFQPVLPSQNFKLTRASSYIFKFVNPPWGTINQQVIETWGNDTAFDATYLSPDGTGKSFTIIETKTDSSAPPKISTPWKSLKKDGKTIYENGATGYGTGVAMIDTGVLYLVSSYISNTNSFTLPQLEQILESLNVPVRTAPDMIKTQTFGAKAPNGVPFAALIPKTIPFKWSTQTGVGETVTIYSGNKKQDTGRLTMTYAHANTQLKLIEALGMKYVNPNVAKADNGVKVDLNDGSQAVYINGGAAVTWVDGGSSNRQVITWTNQKGITLTIVGSMDLSENDLLRVANSLSKPQ